MTERLKKLDVYLEENKLDAMYISSYENYRYYSSFSGSNCHLLVSRSEKLLVTDGRYYEQAAQQAPEFTLVPQKRALAERVSEIVAERKWRRIGYETMKLTDYQLRALKSACPQVEWVPRESFGVYPRMIKDADELLKIKKAVEITDEALKELTAHLRVGMTEREIAAELDYLMAKCGSERCAFDTISASGERGAMPHATPTDRRIAEGDMLTLDFGACYMGYMSDITRTLWFGEPSDELRRVWDAVYKAQRAAVAAVRPGISASELDLLHRKSLEESGYGEYIMHSLGHGVGLEIHEQPRIAPGSADVLSPGMVITIEPGVYIPGLGGVRTEDTVAVTHDGAEVLTKSPHLIKI